MPYPVPSYRGRAWLHWLVIVAVLSLVIASVPAGAAPLAADDSGSHFVRLPVTSLSAATSLGLNPKLAYDYGSFHWLELNDADFATLTASGVPFIGDDAASQVQVRGFVFDPLAGEPEVALAIDTDGPTLRLVQFAGPVTDAWLEQLDTAGLRPLQYYPTNTFLVWGTAAAANRAEGLDFVRWTGTFHASYKINPDVAQRTGRIANVDVMFYNDGAIDATLAALEKLGAKVIQSFPSQPDKAFYNAIVTLDGGAVEAVAGINTVLAIAYSSPEPVLDDEMSSQIIAGNYSGAGVPFTGYNTWLGNIGFNGAGVIWATIDTGVDYDHPDLSSRIVGGYSFPGTCAGPAGTDCPSGGHGTHVTGIIGGDATGGFADAQGFKYGLGVAPGYSIFAMNSLSAGAWPPAGGWQEHSKRAVLGNAIGGNNSWTTGEGTNHGYQASERTHDLMVLDGNFDTAAIEPFIEVFSAGNSGPGANTLTAPKEAKNLIVVASSQNYRVGNINNISSFSSRGPAVDGRIVPTITTPGEQIASTRNDTGGDCSTAIAGTNNLYAYCSGTSMAAPHASGSVVLVTQWWRSFNAGANPSAAMAKALLVNGAVDMGTADIPNFNEGWGRINLSNVINNGVNMVYRDQTTTFGQTGDTWSITVGVPDPSKPLKVTVAWVDAAGAVGANPALVNDLDLTVVNGANTYLGNRFTAGWSVTGGTADRKNNLENVYVQAPAGSATITVDAFNIAGDGVPGNADTTDGSFALVCYNCALQPDYTLTATPASQSICAPANAVYTVNVGSILGYNQPVTLSASGNPAGTTAGFSTNPVTPPGSSTLTIGNTGAAAAGTYNIDVSGASASGPHMTTVVLNLFTAAPAAPVLTAPANGATNVAAQPTFTWNAVAQAASYDLEIATDAAFTNIVHSASGLTGTSYNGASLNTSTQYHWRVKANNTCGVGNWSAVFSFTTVAAPGDCGPGTQPNILYQTDFEGTVTGWTSSGTGNSWALATSNPHSPVQHYHANDVAAVSDQRLASPAVVIPTGENPVTLKFWHVPNLEPSGTTNCYDGGILEASTNGGTTWTQVPNANLLVGPYRSGTVSGSFSNPLAGLQAWCGVTSYMNTIADVSSLAGTTAQFRWRLGTDTSVSAPGWDVDDVVVQSCEQIPTAVEVSSFEDQAPAASPWLLVGLALAGAAAAALIVRRRVTH